MTQLGTSIRIYLADGTPDGLRLVEKANWTGLAIVAPRSLYPEARDRADFDGTGVYVLRAPADDNPTRNRLYIGETDYLRGRLDRHLKDRDWWDDLVVFTSKDENLNKAYIRHLEARLFEIASRAKRAQLDNSQTPQPPRLSEADRADAEGFLANMLLIYPLLGIDAFEIPGVVGRQPTAHPLLVLRGKGAEATGRDLAEGFVIHEGATARADEVASIHGYLTELRKQLVSDGVFVQRHGALLLTQDYTFTSPSTAAGVLLGRSANGRVEWQDETGRTLKDIQESAITTSSGDDR